MLCPAESMKWPNKTAKIYAGARDLIDTRYISKWIFKGIFSKASTRCWESDCFI